MTLEQPLFIPPESVREIIRPQKTKKFVLFFQHPQEPDKELGSATIAHLALPSSKLKIALSVSNLKKALGREEAVPTKWGVLYLGSGFKPGVATDANPNPERGSDLKPGLYPVKKDGSIIPAKEAAQILSDLDGIILLDGTWSQAKTLWWRNSWLLKCRRLILVPKSKSLYGELRKEPRRECLSTIETTADSLDALGEDPAVGQHLRELFATHLRDFREKKRRAKIGPA